MRAQQLELHRHGPEPSWGDISAASPLGSTVRTTTSTRHQGRQAAYERGGRRRWSAPDQPFRGGAGPCGRVVRPEAVFEGKVSDFVIRHTYRMMFANYQHRNYDWPSLMLRILMIHRLAAGVAVYGAIAGRRVL